MRKYFELFFRVFCTFLLGMGALAIVASNVLCFILLFSWGEDYSLLVNLLCKVGILGFFWSEVSLVNRVIINHSK